LINNIINYFGLKEIKDFYLQYQNGSYLDEIKQKLIDLLWLEYKNQYNWEKAIKSFEGEYSIPVMTIHKSKGLEFDTVFFLGLEDNPFFSYSTQKQEDTCAFFVAISRAKRNLYITTSMERNTLERNNGQQSITQIKPFYDALRKSEVVKFFETY
jgi:superfamily I DNA/RNA helicase